MPCHRSACQPTLEPDPTRSSGSLRQPGKGCKVQTGIRHTSCRGPRKCQRLKSTRIDYPVISREAGDRRRRPWYSPVSSRNNHQLSSVTNYRKLPTTREMHFVGSREKLWSPGRGGERQDFPHSRRAAQDPGAPGRASCIPQPPLCPDDFVMTSGSAQSKHSPRFFHGHVLTPNCQHWPPDHPDGKPPFPRA